VYELSSHRTPASVLDELADHFKTSHLDTTVTEKLRIVLFANSRHVFSTLKDVVNSSAGQRYPIALLPVGRSNDISRVSGWGNVFKGAWESAATVPDLLSAVAAAPQVKVDYWRARVATDNKALLKYLPKAFSAGKEVRAGSLIAFLLLLPWCCCLDAPLRAHSHWKPLYSRLCS
jgi:hypothetical protein